jgi:prepilin-type N-terminal cleavage/methylation domain-containing protein
MKFKTKIPRTSAAKSRRAGFTLVECLVALAFMTVVVPVVWQGLHIAALAGEVSTRKAQAMHIAEKVLNETIVTGQWSQNSQGGTEQAGQVQYRWSVHNEPWSAINGIAAISTSNGVNQAVVNGTTLHQLTVDVTFLAQSKNYAVHLSTLINFSQQVTTANLPPAQ